MAETSNTSNVEVPQVDNKNNQTQTASTPVIDKITKYTGIASALLVVIGHLMSIFKKSKE